MKRKRGDRSAWLCPESPDAKTTLQLNFSHFPSPSHFIQHDDFTGTPRLTSLASLLVKVVWPAEERRGEEREDERGRKSLCHPSWTHVKRGQVRALGQRRVPEDVACPSRGLTAPFPQDTPG